MTLTHSTDAYGFEPRLPSTSPEMELATAILMQAVIDCQSSDKQRRMHTRQWFRLPDAGLSWWCEILGLDWEIVQERALAGSEPRCSVHHTPRGTRPDIGDKRARTLEALERDTGARPAEIAKACGVSETFVRSLKRQLLRAEHLALF